MLPAAKEQIPRATKPRFGMTIVWDFSNYTTTWGCVAWRGTLESLAAVFPNPLSLTQNQPLHRLFYFLPAYARFEIQLSFERIDLEKITVRLAGRRTRTVVSDPAEVIPALPFAAGPLRMFDSTS